MCHGSYHIEYPKNKIVWSPKPVNDDGQIFMNAPTHQMAMKWLREEKKTAIIIEFDLTKRGFCPYVYQLDYDMDWVIKWRINIPMKYEEAVEAALKYCLTDSFFEDFEENEDSIECV